MCRATTQIVRHDGTYYPAVDMIRSHSDDPDIENKVKEEPLCGTVERTDPKTGTVTRTRKKADMYIAPGVFAGVSAQMVDFLFASASHASVTDKNIKDVRRKKEESVEDWTRRRLTQGIKAGLNLKRQQYKTWQPDPKAPHQQKPTFVVFSTQGTPHWHMAALDWLNSFSSDMRAAIRRTIAFFRWCFISTKAFAF